MHLVHLEWEIQTFQHGFNLFLDQNLKQESLMEEILYLIYLH